MIQFPRTHIFGQEHLVNVDVVLLVTQDGRLIENDEAAISGFATIPQDDLAQRCHQILPTFVVHIFLSHEDLDDLLGVTFSRNGRIPEIVPRKTSIAGQMAVGVEMLRMAAVFGGRRWVVFLVVGMGLGGADEIGLAGAHLPRILENISGSAPPLPRGTGASPGESPEAVLGL